MYNIEGGENIKAIRAERHLISKSDSYWKIIDEYCFRAKNLYNLANYTIRQEFINNENWIREYDLDKILQKEDAYKKLGSQASQLLIKRLESNWNDFFKAIKDWKKNPSKYLGRPKLPKYLDKNGRSILQLKNIQFKIIDGYLHIGFKSLHSLNKRFKTRCNGKLSELRFIPYGNNYIMEIIYQVEVPKINQNSSNITSIDLGLVNFVTMVNNIGESPIVIKGGILKSINQYYNKKKSHIQSELKIKNNKDWSRKLNDLTSKRNNKIDSFMHLCSKRIIDYCIANNIDTLIVGKNKEWKQNIKLGKINNQNFIYVPFNKFLLMLQYKCENIGIKFVLTEETNTSQASFLDGDVLNQEIFSGKRIKRGLYKSKNGIILNADVNAGYNILKKEFPNAFANGIEGVGLHPVNMKIL